MRFPYVRRFSARSLIDHTCSSDLIYSVGTPSQVPGLGYPTTKRKTGIYIAYCFVRIEKEMKSERNLIWGEI